MKAKSEAKLKTKRTYIDLDLAEIKAEGDSCLFIRTREKGEEFHLIFTDEMQFKAVLDAVQTLHDEFQAKDPDKPCR